MRPERRPPPNGSSLRRTFPSKKRAITTGAPAGRPTAGPSKGHVRKRGKRGGVEGKKKKDVEANAHKRDSFLSSIFKKESIDDTEDIKNMVYRQCYLLLHGIARVHKGDLKWKDEQKVDFIFSQVSLPYLEVAINPAHGDNQLDSHILAAYSFFKYLIATCGLLERRVFIHLILKARESELCIIAAHMNDLLLSFASSFGSVIAASGRVAVNARKQQTFNETKNATNLQLNNLLDGIRNRRIESSKEKDLPSSLTELYCEIEENRETKGKRKVFESSDEEDGEDGDGRDSLKKAVKEEEEVQEEEGVVPMRKVKKEVESEDEKERKRSRKHSKCSSQNGWNDGEDDEENQFNQPSTSSSASNDANEFRSNLVLLARDSWTKSVSLFSIENEPSVKERFKMARFIIDCLEKKYGDELLEILQYFTLQSFDPTCTLQNAEEVIGLLLYLDQRMFIAESFFFLLLAMNEDESVRVALDRSEDCCRSQLEAAKMARKVLLGNPLQVELQTANSTAASKRKTLENSKYHILFPGIIEKNAMKELKSMKREKDREMAKEGRLKAVFVQEFWTTAAKLFNVDSEWTTHAVNESAVRVFQEMNNMFEGSLIGLIRTMSGRNVIADSVFSDSRSGQSLIALNRMMTAGFFDGSLLFALLRFDDANAMKKSVNKLSRLCDGFKKVVETGSKSKGLKTDTNFMSIKSNFTERAMKVNTDCMQFFKALMSSQGRKRRLSDTVEGGEGVEEEGGERKKRKRKARGKKKEKEKEIEVDEEENNGKNDNDEKLKLKKVKEEPKEGEERRKKKKKGKVKREETSDDDDCTIIEVEEKKVKIEVISDEEDEKEKDSEEKKRERERRHSTRSVDGEIKLKDRASEITNNEASRKCKDVLLNNAKQGHSSGGSSCTPLIILPPLEHDIPSPDESVWMYNSEWNVTTLWSQSSEWMEWEKRHRSDMDRLTHRIDCFMRVAVMREEHFEKKKAVLEGLNTVLKEVLERNDWSMFIVGSSPTALGAANSNLDIFVQSPKGKVDLEAVTTVLKQHKEYTLVPFKGKTGIRLSVSNESTGGIPMYVSVHVTPSTAHMCRVYQMADRQDIRVSALSLVLKAWKILDQSCVTAKLQSYHVMSMLIHFLQCGVSPPVIPSLARFGDNLDPRFYRHHDLPDPIPSDNSQSMASLLIGFFIYYSHFQFEKYIISIREGRLLKRNAIGEENMKKIMIENPFEYCLRKSLSVSYDVDFCHVRAACKKALNSLTTSFNIPSLPKL